jgi:hypothetical protein
MFVVEAYRDAALIAFSYLLFSLYLAALFVAIPVGMLPGGPHFLENPAVPVIWLACGWTLFVVLYRLMIRDVPMTGAWLTLTVAAGCLAIGTLFSGALGAGFRGLGGSAEGSLGRLAYHWITLLVSMLAVTVPSIAFWGRLKSLGVPSLAQIVLCLFLPVALFALSPAVLPRLGLPGRPPVEYLAATGRMMAVTLAVLLAVSLAGGSAIWYLFEKRKKASHPDLMIIEDLLDILFNLEDADRDWRSLGVRRLVTDRLEDAAVCLEAMLPAKFSPIDPDLASAALPAFSEKARHFRLLKLLVMIPEEAERDRLVEELRICLLCALRGAWGSLPGVPAGELPKRRSWREISVSLAVAVAPFATLAGLALADNPLLQGENATYAFLGSFLWAAVSLAVVFDPLLGSKIESVKSFLEALRKALGKTENPG